MSDQRTLDGVPKLLLTPEQAAQALGIGRSHVYELLRTQRLKSVRIGACRRVPVAALDEFVAGLQQPDDSDNRDRWGSQRRRPPWEL